MFETLESRRYMSTTTFADGSTASFSNGQLLITAAAKGSNITVNEDARTATVTNVVTGQSAVFYPLTGIKMVGSKMGDQFTYQGNTIGANINGGAAGDIITVTDLGAASSSLNGDAGADILTVVYSHAASINAGSGRDWVKVNTGADFDWANSKISVNAGSDDDHISVYHGTVAVNGGPGVDVLHDLSLGLASITKTKIEATVFA